MMPQHLRIASAGGLVYSVKSSMHTLSPQQINALQQALPPSVIQRGKVSRVAANCYLFHCGDPIDRLHYVIEGELRAIRHQANGQKSIMMRANQQEFFAAASLSMQCFPCDGFAPVDTLLWSIEKPVFYQLLETSAELGKLFSLALSRELKKQCGRLERMRLSTAQERIVHFIQCETQNGQTLELNTPLATWAEELGIEPESLYRTLSNMQKQGLITRNKRNIQMLQT